MPQNQYFLHAFFARRLLDAAEMAAVNEQNREEIMRKLMLGLGFCMGCLGIAQAGTLIKGTGFENEAAVHTIYTNATATSATVNGTVVALNNNAGQTIVSSTSSSATAGDLGFTAEYEVVGGFGYKSTDNFGNANGIKCGVADDLWYSNSVSSFAVSSDPTSTKGYALRDTAGIWRLKFDTVDLTGKSNVTFSFDMFVYATDWDPSPPDWFSAKLVTNLGTTNIVGGSSVDLDNTSYEGHWNHITYDLSNTVTSAQLIVEYRGNAVAESVWIDNIAFSQIPEPRSAGLLAVLSLCAMVVRRIRRM